MCAVKKVAAAVLAALGLASLGGTFAGQLKGADFVSSAGMYLVGIALLAAAKALVCCCCCGPAKKKR